MGWWNAILDAAGGVEVKQLTFIDLFAGIGGFSLGLERAGMKCVAHVEIDPYCRRVLAKHWPDVPCFEDVRNVGRHNLPEANLICGGFPCQPVSCAGKREAEADPRWLWPEFRRCVADLRPRFVLVENVTGLLQRGLAAVLGDFSTLGYAAEWDCIPAAAVGASHRRDRVFVVGYSDRNGCARIQGQTRCRTDKPEERQDVVGASAGSLPDAVGHIVWDEHRRESGSSRQGPAIFGDDGAEEHVADAGGSRLEVGACFGGNARSKLTSFERSCRKGQGMWATEPDVGRVADGVPARVDRLRPLGNAVVPQVAEWIGRRIVEAVNARF